MHGVETKYNIPMELAAVVVAAPAQRQEILRFGTAFVSTIKLC
jgi:hypothetical protein